MIDTDKYEGHTPAPWLWYVDDGDVDLVVADDQCRTVMQEVKVFNTKADAELIKDAPLLLAEVKRLREQTLQLNKQLGAYMRFQLWVQGEHNEIHDSYEDVDEL